MKKNFLLSLILGSIFLCSHAQIKIKPTAGINVSDFSRDVNGVSSGRVGWQFGGSAAFGRNLYIEPGLFWVGKSTEIISSNSTNPDLTIDLNGFRVPLTVGINLLGGQKSPVGLRGFGGASAFFITSEGGVPATIDINKANYGVYAGAGLDISKLFIDFSYEWSVSDIQKDVSQVNWGKSRSMYINAGLRVSL